MTLPRVGLSRTFFALIIVSALPAFLLRATGVMDDSVFWVAAKSLDAGKVLYREVFFTQPPLFIFIPQALWLVTSNIYLHRGFLFAVWLINGLLFYLAVPRLDRGYRLVATGLFLAAAFILQSYALHTEIFILSVFLVALLAVARGLPGAAFLVGLGVSSSLFIKPIGPVVFIPMAYSTVVRGTDRARHLWQMAIGALLPLLVVAVYVLVHGTTRELWQQVVVDNGNIGYSLSDDWLGYVTLAVVTLLVPLFAGILMLDRRPTQLEWWLTAIVFSVLLVIGLLRGARHYGLLNLCVLAWMAVRAQERLEFGRQAHLVGVGLLAILGAVFQMATVGEILSRGSVVDELSASGFVHALPRGSLQVFANNPPRVYMLLNDLVPAYAYLFVYDTDRDLITWDSYAGMIESSPPDYIAVEDSFKAIEYGPVKSSELTDASAVNAWIERAGAYQRLEVGRSLGLTLYQRLERGQGGSLS